MARAKKTIKTAEAIPQVQAEEVKTAEVVETKAPDTTTGEAEIFRGTASLGVYPYTETTGTIVAPYSSKLLVANTAKINGKTYALGRKLWHGDTLTITVKK